MRSADGVERDFSAVVWLADQGEVMFGIELGATGLRQSTGESISFEASTVPPDLLTRVAQGVPYVWTDGETSGISAAHEVYAATVCDAVRARGLADEGVPVAVSVPGWWSPRVLARVGEAIADQGVYALLVSDAEAAVADYASGSDGLPETVVVLNLCETHTSAVVVVDCGGDPSARPSPALVHAEGGRHLDAAVLRYAVAELGEGFHSAGTSPGAAVRADLARCRAVREALSASAREPLQLNPATARVLLTRSELEELATPWIEGVVDIVHSAVEHAAQPVGAVLLTGGLAPMPLVGQRLSADFGLEAFVPDEPRLAAVRGAARLLAIRHRPEKAGGGGLRALVRRLRGETVPSRSRADADFLASLTRADRIAPARHARSRDGRRAEASAPRGGIPVRAGASAGTAAEKPAPAARPREQLVSR